MGTLQVCIADIVAVADCAALESSVGNVGTAVCVLSLALLDFVVDSATFVSVQVTWGCTAG